MPKTPVSEQGNPLWEKNEVWTPWQIRGAYPPAIYSKLSEVGPQRAFGCSVIP